MFSNNSYFWLIVDMTPFISIDNAWIDVTKSALYMIMMSNRWNNQFNLCFNNILNDFDKFFKYEEYFSIKIVIDKTQLVNNQMVRESFLSFFFSTCSRWFRCICVLYSTVQCIVHVHVHVHISLSVHVDIAIKMTIYSFSFHDLLIEK